MFNTVSIKDEICLKASTQVLVLGVGNILLSDEGIGVRVVEELQKLSLPENIELFDGGTSSLDILLAEAKLKKLIVVDALRTTREPGTIYKGSFTAEQLDQLEEVFDKASKFSLHQIGLIDALIAARTLGCAPEETVIIGIEPLEISCGLEISDKLKAQLPKIINIVLKEIENAVHEK